MPTTDPRIDAYIVRQAEFARPILEELRRRVHTACPTAEETIKWGAPAFTHGGKLLAVMAGFKQHVAFNLWHGKQVVGEGAAARDGMASTAGSRRWRTCPASATRPRTSAPR